jgi:acetyl-CoA carboxylase carboxyltransferase component
MKTSAARYLTGNEHKFDIALYTALYVQSMEFVMADGIQNPHGGDAVLAPMQGTVIQVVVAVGDLVQSDDPLCILEAMKMEHVVVAPHAGRVTSVECMAEQTVMPDDVLIRVQASGERRVQAAQNAVRDLNHVRPDLQESIDRHARTLDAARPAAVAKRHRLKQRTARENVDDLCDPGSFTEYGALTLAAQRKRRTVEDLIENTPADGMVVGVGTINGALFGEDARCVVLAYDYTVLAGTQGFQNHRKTDRLIDIARDLNLPLVFFTEGGGGRPGDVDTENLFASWLECPTFTNLARLSGKVPLVGVNQGRCFAGNAAMLGICDVIIATEASNIGMGGPAMIEGGGLGVYTPEDVGPIDVQRQTGVVDLVAKDETDAVALAKQYLSYFQGPLAQWQCADQRALRHCIPENRLRMYDIREVIHLLADTGSVLELRRDFGLGAITAFIRIEGRPLGLIANNPAFLAGAIESDGAKKMARFMRLCNAFKIPILFLCDTPGIMVGPEAEKSGTVRHASELFIVGAQLEIPFATIILRKCYGLGAQTMVGGHQWGSKAPSSWALSANSKRSRTRRRATPSSSGWSRRCINTARP